jgi:hypothetical protein
METGENIEGDDVASLNVLDCGERGIRNPPQKYKLDR